MEMVESVLESSAHHSPTVEGNEEERSTVEVHIGLAANQVPS